MTSVARQGRLRGPFYGFDGTAGLAVPTLPLVEHGLSEPEVDALLRAPPSTDWSLTAGALFGEDGILFSPNEGEYSLHNEFLNEIQVLGVNRTRQITRVELMNKNFALAEYARLYGNVVTPVAPVARQVNATGMVTTAGAPGYYEMDLELPRTMEERAYMFRGYSPYGDRYWWQWWCPSMVRIDNAQFRGIKGFPGETVNLIAVKHPTLGVGKIRAGYVSAIPTLMQANVSIAAGANSVLGEADNGDEPYTYAVLGLDQMEGVTFDPSNRQLAVAAGTATQAATTLTYEARDWDGDLVRVNFDLTTT